jgi:hypothetical protein
MAAATSVRSRTTLVLLAGAATTAVLGFAPGPLELLVAVSILVGAARGIFTLLQATAITDRWGGVHYGRLSGVLSTPIILATSLAPLGRAPPSPGAGRLTLRVSEHG